MTSDRDPNPSRPGTETGRHSGLALPHRAYIPQRTVRHAEGTFDAIRGQACATTTTDSAAANPAWLYGLDLIENAFYWEAHEVLEAVWMNAAPNASERNQVQAVIQLANAALKHEMGRPNAANRLCDIAQSLADEAHRAVEAQSHQDVMGMDIRSISAAIEVVRVSVQTAQRLKVRF